MWLHLQQKSLQISISLTNGIHGHLVLVLVLRLSSKEMSTVKLKPNGSTVVMFVLFPMVNGLNIQETVTYHPLKMLPTHILHFLDLIHNTKSSFPKHLSSHSSEIGKFKYISTRCEFTNLTFILRDWVPAADLRIDELRKIDLRIDTSNLPSVSKIELEMTDSDFIWGAMVDNYMEDEACIQRLFYLINRPVGS